MNETDKGIRGYIENLPPNQVQDTLKSGELDEWLQNNVWNSRPGSEHKFVRMGPKTYADFMHSKAVWDLIHKNRFNPFSQYFWRGLYRYTLGRLVYWFGRKFLDW